MSVNLQVGIYLIIVLAAFIISLFRFRILDRSLKVVAVLLGFTFVIECAAAWSALKFHTNMAVYHFYTPVCIVLSALYYHFAIPAIRKSKAAFVVIAAGIVAFVLNTVFLQPLNMLDSNMMLFAGFCVVALALYTFYLFFKDENSGQLTNNIHFWISFLFLLFWCGTFFFWAFMQALLIMNRQHLLHQIYLAIWISNLVLYGGLALLFYKMTTNKKL